MKMVRSIEKTVARLTELAAPKLLIRQASGMRASGALEYEFQVPHVFYMAGNDARIPFRDRLVPLWETNGDSITAYVDNEKPMVIRYYYEDPPDQFEVVGHSIMEAIEDKLAWLLGECGYEPAEILAPLEPANIHQPKYSSEACKKTAVREVTLEPKDVRPLGAGEILHIRSLPAA